MGGKVGYHRLLQNRLTAELRRSRSCTPRARKRPWIRDLAWMSSKTLPVESAPVERCPDLLGVQVRCPQQFDFRAGERPVELKCSLHPPRFFRAQKQAKKSRRNSSVMSVGCRIESFSKRNRVVLKAEIESFSKCPHIVDFNGGPGRTRTCNQTVMSGRLQPLNDSIGGDASVTGGRRASVQYLVTLSQLLLDRPPARHDSAFTLLTRLLSSWTKKTTPNNIGVERIILNEIAVWLDDVTHQGE
jgi:hypothetical protein